MIKHVIDEGFVVVKLYADSKASLSYSLIHDAYVLTVEGVKITEGIVQRSCIDFDVEIISVVATFDTSHRYLVILRKYR